MTHTELQYRNYDSKQPQRPSIDWEKVVTPDDCSDAPDERDDGYWPSRDPDDCGYVGEITDEEFQAMHDKAQARYDAWKRGDWCFVGIAAKATIHVPIGCGSFTSYTLQSPGIWGIEGDDAFDTSEGYRNEVYEEQKAELLHHLKAIGEFVSTLGEN
mgnify:CR=1 FL=1